MINAALIISIYNRIDYLKLVFAGLNRQTFRGFEVILADDGSNDESIKEIEFLSNTVEFPVLHLWQEDRGFRKNKILNRAILAVASDYLIFIDGDCVPHKEFIKEHFDQRKEKLCLTGRRVNLSERITKKLTPQIVEEGFLERKYFLLPDGLFGKSFDVEKGIYFKNSFLREYFNKKRRGLLGCNFSIHKKDLLEINGFDERYEAPSIGEDTDVQFRLELNGVSIKSLNNIAIQYHLYHELQKRPQKNLDLFEAVKTENSAFTQYGISGSELILNKNKVVR
jgi:glycosyltransferase involved in cell wall biosynthesis